MKRAELALGLGVSAVGAGALAMALGMRFFTGGGPGPGFFPVLCSSALTVLGLILAWQSLQAALPEVRAVGPVGAAEARRRKLSTLEPDEPDPRRTLAVWGGYVAAVPVLYGLGFTLTMTALMAYLLVVVERRWSPRAIAAVLLVPAAVYLLFVHLLGIDLPEGLVGTRVPALGTIGL